MNPGRLDRRIKIETETATISASGERVPTWSTLADNVAAEKRDVSGREQSSNGQEVAVGNTLFRIRWRDDIKPTAQVVYLAETYNILVVREIGRRRYLELITEVKEAA